ncbi:MAG: S1C family serine protease [Candidatus Onthomonas sp.]
MAEYVSSRTVTVNADNSTGSGFFISSDGILVTNYHVIEGAEQITVDIFDGGSYTVSKIIDFSKVYDLALLKLDLNDTPYLELCKEVKTGESVYAVGSSLGVLEGSFTGGTVSSTNRMHGKIECIQMDASIASGNSGGPLVNVYGEVVGVNAFSYTNGQNANLAIKIAMLDHLDQERNLSLSGYREWYNKETSRSYSPFDDNLSYYYSTINTYSTVTGQKCQYSITEDGETEYGYVDMCLWYGYAYSASELDTYTEYLNSIGFEYDTSLSGENQYFYYSEIDNVYIYCEVLTQDEIVEVMPIKPSALEALMSGD